MKVLVCGSRTWDDYDAIETRFALLPDCEIIHGGARGVDRMAAKAALDFGFSVKEFPAEWEKHGRAAGPIRNLRMLDEEPDLVLAFWDGKSVGTAHMIRAAQLKRVPVEIHQP